MEMQELVDDVVAHPEDARTQGVFRFYELAKRAEWRTSDLPWGELPPIPETTGTPQKIARRRDIWRSVITQQLQADTLAVEMAAQLLELAPDIEAKLYYSTMLQDEARHVEAWFKSSARRAASGARPAPRQARTTFLNLDSLEEKVFSCRSSSSA